ncbi:MULTISPECIES: MDR family MFS transporter [Flavobacterium]|uniref:MFS transporter n=2 Tax=Flavobacterium TaxID=237 RepID=A0ABU9I5E1_9FLAO|nr:MFS transporter [Flavobacterium cheniae]TDR25970.1 putative MFS family arabinose efflux permease [Flavobacterium cheniae]TWH95576.1 putative MFS family arabinose efflux permease [Flavobacterium cheniae]
MLQRAFNKYIDNFRGFSREIWILTLITFINRAGTMVLPFLSKYLREDLDFSYNQVKWILISFGLGSIVGSWLGGKLSDKIGFYKIMIFSLMTSGIAFFGLQFVTSFEGLLVAMFFIMVVADMFRPAMFVSLGAYAKPENRTRALTLVRLAINLGFAAGPALGGLLIMTVGYKGLFWVDGATCILAILIFWIKVKEKKKSKYTDKEHPGEILTNSVFKDRPFWIFLGATLITGILFFQLFTTIPLYHKEQFNLSELQTGLLLTLNGVLIFFLEMPIVSYIERHKINKLKVITLGCLAMAISMYLLLVNQWAGILIIMMLFMTFGEMFVFPFSNSFAISRAPKGHEGRYMAIFTMSYSTAHILSAEAGMDMIRLFSYQNNWFFMGTLGIIGVLLFIWTMKLVKYEPPRNI